MDSMPCPQERLKNLSAKDLRQSNRLIRNSNPFFVIFDSKIKIFSPLTPDIRGYDKGDKKKFNFVRKLP